MKRKVKQFTTSTGDTIIAAKPCKSPRFVRGAKVEKDEPRFKKLEDGDVFVMGVDSVTSVASAMWSTPRYRFIPRRVFRMKKWWNPKTWSKWYVEMEYRVAKEEWKTPTAKKIPWEAN